MNGLKILQKTETLHEARWWEPKPTAACIVIFVRAIAISIRDKLGFASSA